MRKTRGIIITIVALILAILAGYKLFFSGSDGGDKVTKKEPLKIMSSSDAFTESVNGCLTQYLVMKDAFVQSDTAKVRVAASAFAGNMDSLSMDGLKTDTLLKDLANELRGRIAEASRLIMSATDVDGKKRAFQTASDLLFDLLRTVQYRGALVYQQHCPMAFNNEGANWLSLEKEIFNPYFGDKMLHCGQVQDSIAYLP